MDLLELINDKALKGTDKRTRIISAIMNNSLSLSEIDKVSNLVNDKQMAVILEAIEEITNKKRKQVDASFIKFAEKFITADSNSCKRETSRIIGNLAGQYPDDLEGAIKPLILNTDNKSTVVRWGSAYALSRIVILSKYRNTGLVEQIRVICEKEQENGVKNQYAKALKKISDTIK